MQPEDLDEARDWLVRADRDLIAARAMFDLGVPLLDAVAFHSQQTIEKALKGFLSAHAVVFDRTHQLEPLARRCAALDGTFLPYAPRVGPLSTYAVRFRYPGGPIEPTVTEARDALEIAADVLAFVQSRLPAS